MIAAAIGPYEHTGAYRPDVLAQLELTEPQWSDAPAECESPEPEPDLTGQPLPSLRDFAWAIANEIDDDADMSNAGRALGHAALVIALQVVDVRAADRAEPHLHAYYRSEWRNSWSAMQNLRTIRLVQLGGYDALRRYREERS